MTQLKTVYINDHLPKNEIELSNLSKSQQVFIENRRLYLNIYYETVEKYMLEY